MTRPLRVGEPAPDSHAPDEQGRRRSLADWKGRPLVLYFYPHDHTPGCTAQGCAYRDEHPSFESLGVDVVGVSRDDEESHGRFAARHALPFTLLADTTGAMHEAYGATMLGGLPRRISYLIGSDGRIASVYESNLRPAVHARKMLEAAQRLASPTQTS